MVTFGTIVGDLDLRPIATCADHLTLMTHHVIAVDVDHRTKATLRTHACIGVCPANLLDQQVIAVFQNTSIFDHQFVKGESIDRRYQALHKDGITCGIGVLGIGCV